MAQAALAVDARTEVSKDYAPATCAVEMLGNATERKANTVSIQTAAGSDRKALSVVLRPYFSVTLCSSQHFAVGNLAWSSLEFDRYLHPSCLHPSYAHLVF